MTSLLTRLICALLSIVGAAGLVAFANPANAIGGSPKASVIIAATAGVASIAHHG